MHLEQKIYKKSNALHFPAQPTLTCQKREYTEHIFYNPWENNAASFNKEDPLS